MKNALIITDKKSDLGKAGQFLLLKDKSIEFWDNGNVQSSQIFNASISSSVGSIEALLFFIKILEQHQAIDNLVINTKIADFIAFFAKQKFAIKYQLSGIDDLPVSDWNLAYNATSFNNCNDLLSRCFLPRSYQADIKPFQDLNQSDSLSIAIVAYYNAPFIGVGSKRPAYMCDFFNSQDDIDCKLIGTIPNPDSNYVYVPDYGFSPYQILDEDLQVLQSNGINIIGASWSQQLKTYFDNQYQKHGSLPNCIILSGNPFYYFDLGEYLKNTYGTMVVLDYRDPFSNNPLMYGSVQVKKIQQRIEKEFNSFADLIAVVNQPCKKLLEGVVVDDDRIVVIENGYNPELFNTEVSKSKFDNKSLNFVYAGSFNAFRNGQNFADAIEGSNHKLTYMGSAQQFGLNNQNVENLGMLPEQDAANQICSADIGVVFATGEEFESTTKVYEYIAAQLPILIVTNGELNQGAIDELSKGLEQVYWVKNDKQSIEKFLQNTNFQEVSREGRMRFSREYFSNKLLEQIKQRVSL